ncbi:TrmH family RNA methyltransferase [Ileibacterium valens]|nr:RNA methyltransferase [Ileibacterium valens]
MENNMEKLIRRLPSMNEEVIASASNQTIKTLARLLLKKYRDESDYFLAEGAHMLQEASQAGLLKAIFVLWEDQEARSSILQVIENHPEIPVINCSKSALGKLSSLKSESRLIGLCQKVQFDAKSASRILMLENVQDPGNVGTLIRSAYSFGADCVVLSEGCADGYNPKVLQATQGALFYIPLISKEIHKAISSCKDHDIPVFAAALHHDSIALSKVEHPEKFALLIGNEGQGLTKETIESADYVIHIEMSAFESLNAAIAGSIILYQFQPGL